MGIKKGINKSLRRLCINCLKRAYLSAHSMSRVIYDRTGNREICFEISTFLPIEWHKKSGKIQSNVTLPSNWWCLFGFWFDLNFLLLMFVMKFKKATMSKYFFLFCTLSYVTLKITNPILKYRFQVSGLPLCDLLGGNHQDDILLYRAIR